MVATQTLYNGWHHSKYNYSYLDLLASDDQIKLNYDGSLLLYAIMMIPLTVYKILKQIKITNQIYYFKLKNKIINK